MLRHYAIKYSVQCLIKNDRYLLENEINERSQTHKLAEYLQAILPNWNVDCEYNKNLNRSKELGLSKIVESIRERLSVDNNDSSGLYEELQDFGGKELEDESGMLSYLQFTSSEKRKSYVKRVYPDIIAHLRGSKNNKIVIEAKRAGNTEIKARMFDLMKLALFTEHNGQYGYQTGYFVNLPKVIPKKFQITVYKCNDRLIVGISHNVYIVTITAI